MFTLSHGYQSWEVLSTRAIIKIKETNFRIIEIKLKNHVPIENYHRPFDVHYYSVYACVNLAFKFRSKVERHR